MTPFRQEIDRLRRDYPAFVIVPTRVYNGERVAAYRQDRAPCNGLYAVIGTPQEVEAELAKVVAELKTGLGLLGFARHEPFATHLRAATRAPSCAPGSTGSTAVSSPRR